MGYLKHLVFSKDGSFSSKRVSAKLLITGWLVFILHEYTNPSCLNSSKSYSQALPYLGELEGALQLLWLMCRKVFHKLYTFKAFGIFIWLMVHIAPKFVDTHVTAFIHPVFYIFQYSGY